MEGERGERFDLSYHYNDRRRRPRARAGLVAPAAAEIRGALGDTELSWKQHAHFPKIKLHLCVEDPPGAIDLVLSADERYFSRTDMETLARAIEEVAVQAATAPQTPTGIICPITAG